MKDLPDPRWPVTIGVSLKMYFGYEETVRWCEAVRGHQSSVHQAITGGAVELFVIPSYPVLSTAKKCFRRPMWVSAAQNLHWAIPDRSRVR